MPRLLLFLLIFVTPQTNAVAEQPFRLRGSCMGTTYAVTIADDAKKPLLNDLDRQIADELDRIEQVFSLYRPNSEISRFNAVLSSEWINVSADFLAVTQQAIELATQTNGAFDPTVAPLIRLWRLQQITSDWSPPTAVAIAEVRKRVNFRLLEARNNPPAIRKLKSDVELDLNAIVEGWAIDCVFNLLQQHGIHNVLIELGGEFRAIGRKPGDQPWKIGIENPLEPTSLYATAILTDAALATSGTYRQMIEHGGRRYSHLLDARTGEPVQHNLLAVSVIADGATTVDSWATALMVLGPTEGFALAEKKGLAASFASRAGAKLQVKLTTSAKSQIKLVDK